jgi:hypothetical protein
MYILLPKALEGLDNHEDGWSCHCFKRNNSLGMVVKD